MKNTKFDGVIENAYGKPLETPLKYEAEYDEYENIDEVRTANDLPKDKEIVDFRNAQRKANARQKAMQAALDAAGIIKPTLENDAQLRLRNMAKTLVAAGKTEEEARAIAEQVLGDKWAD